MKPLLAVIIDNLSINSTLFSGMNTVIILICIFLDPPLSHRNLEHSPNTVSFIVVNYFPFNR